jgi:tRNA(Ser,Leu) C12 N-acetylase TAN1
MLAEDAIKAAAKDYLSKNEDLRVDINKRKTASTSAV